MLTPRPSSVRKAGFGGGLLWRVSRTSTLDRLFSPTRIDWLAGLRLAWSTEPGETKPTRSPCIGPVPAYRFGKAPEWGQPEQIGVFVRSPDQLSRAERAVRTAGCEAIHLDAGADPTDGKVPIATMHLAKGLEFKAVAVVAVDDSVVPLESRVELIADEADLEEVYNTERHLLYVACTRARDLLLVSGLQPVSEFMIDLTDAASRRSTTHA